MSNLVKKPEYLMCKEAHSLKNFTEVKYIKQDGIGFFSSTNHLCNQLSIILLHIFPCVYLPSTCVYPIILFLAYFTYRRTAKIAIVKLLKPCFFATKTLRFYRFRFYRHECDAYCVYIVALWFDFELGIILEMVHSFVHRSCLEGSIVF